MGKVLIVDAGLARADALCARLVSDDHEVQRVADASLAQPEAQEEPPDVVICTLEGDGRASLELCRSFRDHDATARARFMVVCDTDEEAAIVSCLDACEHDVVTPPLTVEVLAARVRAQLRRKAASDQTADKVAELEESYLMLEAVSEHLDEMSLQDGLTWLGNRRAMELQLERVHSTAKRYERVYSVVLIDVDFFKKYNDHYGHQAGDDVLKAVAEALAGALRDADVLYRYGGEEMLALFAETDCTGAQAAAEKLRAAVEALAVEHCESPMGHLSISLGVAECRPDPHAESTWEAVVEQADRGLYAAKENGRNRVETAE